MDYKFINDEYLDSVSGGDPLQKLSEYIDWSIFEAPLDQAFRNETKSRCVQLKIVVAMRYLPDACLPVGRVGRGMSKCKNLHVIMY
ncbi:MAG: hypothetical protein Q8N38_11615 [Bacteroidales bacterium]|nr:hypothetical protein [Bacteroidales bacterium]